MEYRAYLTLSGIDFASESVWEPLIEHLERDHSDLGPVIGFGEPGAEIIIAMDSSSAAEVARRAVEITTEALRALGRADLYPSAVEVERVPHDELARA